MLSIKQDSTDGIIIGTKRPFLFYNPVICVPVNVSNNIVILYYFVASTALAMSLFCSFIHTINKPVKQLNPIVKVNKLRLGEAEHLLTLDYSSQ